MQILGFSVNVGCAGALCRFNAWRDVKISLSLYFCLGDTIKPVYLILHWNLFWEYVVTCMCVSRGPCTMYIHLCMCISKTWFLTIIEHAYTVAYDWYAGTCSTSGTTSPSHSYFVYLFDENKPSNANYETTSVRPSVIMWNVTCALWIYISEVRVHLCLVHVRSSCTVSTFTCTCLYILYMQIQYVTVCVYTSSCKSMCAYMYILLLDPHVHV